MTIKTAVLHSFNHLPAQFHIWQLINMVRDMTGREYVTDGTVTRKLRELRFDDKVINYDYKHSEHKYHKKELGEYKQVEMFVGQPDGC